MTSRELVLEKFTSRLGYKRSINLSENFKSTIIGFVKIKVFLRYRLHNNNNLSIKVTVLKILESKNRKRIIF